MVTESEVLGWYQFRPVRSITSENNVPLLKLTEIGESDRRKLLLLRVTRQTTYGLKRCRQVTVDID